MVAERGAQQTVSGWCVTDHYTLMSKISPCLIPDDDDAGLFPMGGTTGVLFSSSKSCTAKYFLQYIYYYHVTIRAVYSHIIPFTTLPQSLSEQKTGSPPLLQIYISVGTGLAICEVTV